jgi:hypothetical protein
MAHSATKNAGQKYAFAHKHGGVTESELKKLRTAAFGSRRHGDASPKNPATNRAT